MNVANLSLLSPISRSQKNMGLPYLSLRLDDQNLALIEMPYTQEVLVVAAERITAIPNLAASVLGLLNQRNRVLWVIDLPQLLGLNPIALDTQQYNLAIIQVGQFPLGLAVAGIEGVMRFNQDAIQSPIGAVQSELTPYLQGCILTEKQVLLVLDASAIVHCPNFNLIK